MSLLEWVDGPSGLPGLALDLAARSTLLLAVALGAWRLLGRRRPLIGSAIGQAGVLGLLILPISATLGPPLAIPILEAPAAPAPTPKRAEVPGFVPPFWPDPVAIDPAPPERMRPLPVVETMAIPGPPNVVAPTPEASRPSIGLGPVLIGVYAVGALAMLGRLAGSMAGVARLRRSGVPVDDPTWLGALDRLRGRLGIARPVGLARSSRVGVPVVVGWLRPTILLPDAPGGCSPEHAGAILLHELAHVRRGDYAWNVLLHLVGALYWPHPMAWLLARAVAESRERACDAFCVHEMGGPAPYRSALLAMAEGLSRRPAPALGLAMARPSRLARRIAEIDRGRTEPRCLPRWPARVALGTLGLALAATLGPAQLTRAEPRPTPVVEVQEPKPAAEPAPTAGLSFSGRVIEKDTGKAVPGATIVVTRSLVAAGGGEVPPWVGDSTLLTDVNGRFTINFPPEQVAEPRLGVALSRVAHPDFVPRKGFRVPLASLLLERQHGEGPYFETVTLIRGMEFSGQVVAPDGTPAAGVPFWFENWGWGDNRARNFTDDDQGRTDGEGRLRLRMARTRSLAIRLTPERYAPYQRFLGTVDPSRNPDTWVPGDLGRLVLEPGPVLSGRLLDLQGRPVAGRTLTTLGRLNRVSRAATTEADGRFAFAPLRPGNYGIYGEGQNMYGGLDYSQSPMPTDAIVVRPSAVYLEAGITPEPLELREAPTVRVAVRFVDSRGRPFRGAAVKLWGILPSGKVGTDPFDTGLPGVSPASSINDPETRSTGGRIDWAAQMVSDAEGLAVFRAPKGLRNADLYTVPPDETTAFKTRLVAGGPLKFWGGGQLGDLEADRKGLEVIAYRAPTVLARIATEGGEPVPGDASLNVGFTVRGGSYGGGEVRQADGRYRTQGLMPDHEYEFSAWAEGYVPRRAERLSLPEGATAELTLILRKRPTPPAVGDPAPPFAVGTLDGRSVGPGDFRGRLLLLHVWGPFHGDDRDLPRFNAIRKRFNGDRLALLGLSLSDEPQDSRDVIRDRNLAWPQAILRGWYANPMIADYGVRDLPSSILIGPDGAILARDLAGEKIEEAIARALGE